jgi:hypothetical protein
MRKRVEKQKGPTGRAEVRVLKDEIKVIDLDSHEVHHISPDDIGTDTVVKSGHNLFYRLSTDGTKLYGLNPWDGNHFMRVKAFLPPPRSEGQTIPASYVLPGGQVMAGREGRGSWVTRDRSVFNVLFEIVGGEFEGMSAVKMFTYMFRAGQDDLVEMVGGGGKDYKALDEFLTAAGFDWDKDNVPFSNNILPDLQTLLKKRAVVFLGKFENGWLTSFSKPPAGMAPPVKRGRKPKVVVESEPRDEPVEE